jgi:hypothetical protein
LLGGIVALGLLAGAVTTFAQTEEPTPTPAVPETTTPEATTPSLRGGSRLGDDEEALAAALGITVEELDAAKETGRLAMIDQAVTDGLITEAQAETLRAADTGFSRLARSFNYEKDEYLADALGITVDELNAAQLTAYQTQVAAAVAAGTITQAEADLLLARKAAQSYLDTDALNAAVLAAYEDALAEAVAAGDITQAQADALLAQLQTQSFDFGFGGHGRGHGGGGRHGGHGGFGLDLTPDTAPETTPGSDSTTTDTALDA